MTPTRAIFVLLCIAAFIAVLWLFGCVQDVVRELEQHPKANPGATTRRVDGFDA